MRHATNIAVLAFAVFCGTAIAAEAPGERVPHFADYPVKAASVRPSARTLRAGRR